VLLLILQQQLACLPQPLRKASRTLKTFSQLAFCKAVVSHKTMRPH